MKIIKDNKETILKYATYQESIDYLDVDFKDREKIDEFGYTFKYQDSILKLEIDRMDKIMLVLRNNSSRYCEDCSSYEDSCYTCHKMSEWSMSDKFAKEVAMEILEELEDDIK